MAWFSGGLTQFSNITDQISSFTKEVLTETTEEVEDPGAELQVAKKRVAELEALNEHIRNEYEKLKLHDEELNERMETSECQIATISQEYRKLLQERDQEIKRVRSENERLREEHKHLVHDVSARSPLKELAGGGFFQNGGSFETIDIGEGGGVSGEAGWTDELTNFSDMVSSQGEINRLQSELARLKVECQHWRDTAKQQTPLTNVDNSPSLHDQIKDLHSSLQREVDQHQHELSSMQTIHSEKINALNLRHQHEVDQLQQLVSLPSHRAGETCEGCDRLGREVELLQEQTIKYERENKKQCNEIVVLKELISKLKREIECMATDKELFDRRLFESVTLLKQESECEMVSERNRLQSQLELLQSTIGHSQDVITKLQKEHSHSKTEVEQLKSNVESLEDQVIQKESEILSLRQLSIESNKLSSLERELEEKSLLLETNKESLREFGQLVERKDEELSSVRESFRELQVREEAKLADLENKHIQERERLEQNMALLKEQKQTTSTSNTQHEELILKLQYDLSRVEVSLKQSNSELRELSLERDKLTSMLSSKEDIIKDLTTSLSQVKGRLTAKENELSSMISQQSVFESNQFDSLKTRNETLTTELQRKEEECSKYSKQLGQLRAHLLEVEERYTEEALRADERETTVKEELSLLKQKILNSANEDSLQCHHLQEKVSQVEAQLEATIEQRDDALLQMTNAQEQAHQNATALRNLQTVLEQFQRDQSSELAQALKRSQTELADTRTECQLLHTEHAQLQARANRSEDEVSALKMELADREKTVKELLAQTGDLTHALEEERRRMVLEDKERVDRNLVKNLVLGYVHATDVKKPEVLHLVGKILGFSDEELTNAVGKGRGKGWLRGLWDGTPAQMPSQESLSQLFVKFLQSESSPESGTPIVTGYVDSRTDPDRPSLATAAILGSRPLAHPPSPPSNQPEHSRTEKLATKHSEFLVPTLTTPSSGAQINSSQSTILSSVLDS